LTTNYGHDSIYQLLSATQSGSTTESYTYDPVGNRLSSLGVASYSNNSSNELTATSNASYLRFEWKRGHEERFDGHHDVCVGF
jgi:YD repeat-containing protein